MSPKVIPHLKCQKCHHKHATHSILGAILLCEDCYRIVFASLPTQLPLLKEN